MSEPENVLSLFREKDRKQLEEIRRMRGVPLRLWPLAIGTPAQTPALSVVESFLKVRSFLVVVSGNPGCGKSQAAAVAVARTGFSLWRHATDFEKLPDQGQRSEKWLNEAALVVVDDAGREHDGPNRYALHRICELLEQREADMLPSIVTTNLDADDFRKRYGERLVSRISGDPLGFQIVSGPDLRKYPPTSS